MLTIEQLDGLERGDQLDLPGLFPGLTDAPVVLLVSGRGPDGVAFEGRYFGVLLGHWTAFEQGGSIGWRYRKPPRGGQGDGAGAGGQGDWLAPGMDP